MPDEVSKKSLKALDKKLQLLAEHADFHVNINSVVGGGIRNPLDALVVGKRAVELGFTSTVGIIHDGTGQLQPLAPDEREVYAEMRGMEKSSYAQINYFQDNIAHGKENQWRCRAGARYLYICEDGLVHYCSQQRGYPAKPLAEYTVADIRREFLTENLRAALHGGLRAPDFVYGLLASAAIPHAGRHAAGGSRSGWCRFDKRRVRSGVRIADWAVVQRYIWSACSEFFSF